MPSKDEAQEELKKISTLAKYQGGVWTHYKVGGEYVVFALSLDEATLEPLVHYYSLTKKTRWTRKLEVWLHATVDVGNEFGPEWREVSRFTYTRMATREERLEAAGLQ